MIDHTVPGFGTYQYEQDLYDEAMARTVPDLLAEVLEQVRDLDKGSVTKARKLRKAELAAMVAEWSTGARDNERYSAQMDALQAEHEQDMTGHWAEDLPEAVAQHDASAAVLVDTVRGEDGFLRRAPETSYEEHTYLTDDQLQDRVGDAMVKAVTATKQVTEEISTVARQAARALVPVAYAGYVAVVRSMGRTVRGKVVDADLRAPDRDGANRVLLVVEHSNGAPGRKATRTLHALVDVKLEPVAS